MVSERIQNILRSVHDKVQRLMEVDRFYVALHDPLRAELEFPLVVDSDDLAETSRTPWTRRPYQGRALLPDRVIAQQTPLLFEHDLAGRIEEAGVKYWPDDERPLSWLGAPMVVEDEVIGVLVTENRHKPRAFGEGKIRVLSTIARQTAMAIQNARLYERLARKIANLSAVNEVGRQLTSGIRLSEPEILELIYEQASRLMDTDNMYIALYDEERDTVRFGLALVGGRRVGVATEEGWQPRRAGQGRTEWIIRHRKPLVSATRAESEAWYEQVGHKEYIGQPFASWIGVPMIASEERVLGVIATYHATKDYIYDKDDLQVLSLMASQVAIALDNAKLYDHLEEMVEQRTQQLGEAQQRIMAAERLAAANTVSSEFAHRLNNLAGTIPVRVDMARGLLNPHKGRDRSIIHILDGIQADTRRLLKAAEDIRKGSAALHLELIDLNNLITLALRNAYVPPSIHVSTDLESALPPIKASVDHLNETLSNLISNAVDAMPGGGKLELKTRRVTAGDRRWARLEVTDTGKGIPPEGLKDIFQLFYTTKPHGLGYGLWRDRNLAEHLSGKLEVESQPGEGATFTLTLPAAE